MPNKLLFQIDAYSFEKKFIRIFIGMNLLLVVLDSVLGFTKFIGHSDLRDLVDMGTEHSLNNWLSSQMWLFSTFALSLLALLAYQEKKKSYEILPWVLLAGLFLVLACDDGVAIHERIGTAVEDYFRGKGPVPGKKHEPGKVDSLLISFGSYTWQLAVLPFYAAAGFGMLYFCWSRLGNTRARRYFIGGIVLMGVAVVLDHFEAKWDLHQGDFGWLPKAIVNHYQRVLEEFLEATAEVCFACGFLLHTLTQFRSVKLTSGASQPSPA